MTCVSDYWHIYQRALLPKTAPHMPPRTELLSNKYLLDNKLLFARWLSDFDCGFETEWYCVIKDDNFSVDSLKAKRRYEINKGNRNFYCKVIEPVEIYDAVYEVFVEAFSVYPTKYRPQLNKSSFRKQVEEMTAQGQIFIGAFDRVVNTLKGVAVLICNDDFINYSMHKVFPDQEKKQLMQLLCMEYYLTVK